MATPSSRQQPAQQRQGEADDVAVVAVDAVDERRRAAVEGERPGDVERFAARRRTRRSRRPSARRSGPTVDAVADARRAGRGVDHAVAGLQHAGAAAHRLPAGGGLLGVGGLAERLARPARAPSRSRSPARPRPRAARPPRRPWPRRGPAPARRGSGRSAASSSTPLTMTSGASPACRSRSEPGGGGGGEHEAGARCGGHGPHRRCRTDGVRPCP